MASDWTCCCICHDGQRGHYCPDCEMYHSGDEEKLNSRIAELERARCPDPAIHNTSEIKTEKRGSILDAILGIGLACAFVIGGLIYALRADNNPVNSTDEVAAAANDEVTADPSSYICRWRGERYLCLRLDGNVWLVDCRFTALRDQSLDSRSVKQLNSLTDEEFNKYFRLMFGDGGKPILVKPLEALPAQNPALLGSEPRTTTSCIRGEEF